MKLLRKMGQLYALACALLIAVVGMGVGLAYAFGLVPERPLEKIVAALEPGANSSATPTVEVRRKKTPTEIADELDERRAPDLRLWSRRLEQVGEGIQADLAVLDERQTRLEAEERRLEEVSRTLTQVLTTILGEEITSGQLLASADEVVSRLETQDREEIRKPWLLEAIESMQARDIAVLFSGVGSDAGEGLREGEAVELLGGLPPRKAGQVLAEMGKVDPTRAARLLARMGRVDASDQGSMDGGQVQ